MTAILTSSLGGACKVAGRRFPIPIENTNGLLDCLKAHWPESPQVLLVSASPEAYDRNDNIRDTFQASLPVSGLDIAALDLCDARTPHLAERLPSHGVVILTGGHVPTQNAFLHSIRLREHLADYTGLVVAWSAGSMNAAQVVYALPELEGEGADPGYQRFIPGLGLTRRMIIPHYQDVQHDVVDGQNVIRHMALPDSTGRAFLALNDGSYLLVEDGRETVYGDAWLIRNGAIRQVCTLGGHYRLT